MQALSCTKCSTGLGPLGSRSNDPSCVQLQDLEGGGLGGAGGAQGKGSLGAGVVLGGLCGDSSSEPLPPGESPPSRLWRWSPSHPASLPTECRHMKSVCVYLPALSGESYCEILQCLIPWGHWDFRERVGKRHLFCLNANGSFLRPS